MTDLAERFMREHVAVRCKPWTVMSYRGALAKWILPALGRMAIGAVEHEHVAALHYRLRDIPYRANQVLAILNRMFSPSRDMGLAAGRNPPLPFDPEVPGVPPGTVPVGERSSGGSGGVLDEVEAESRDKGGVSVRASAVAAIRVLMLTGCRRDEILTLKWGDVVLDAGELHLRDRKTGVLFPLIVSRQHNQPCVA